MAGGAARWRRERERWSSRRAQSAGWKGFSIIGALRNTRCMMWLIFYYLQIKTEKVEPRRIGEEGTYRVEAGCHHWEKSLRLQKKYYAKRGTLGNENTARAPRRRWKFNIITRSGCEKGKTDPYFNLRSAPCRRIESLLEFQLNYFPRSLCHTSQVEKERARGAFLSWQRGDYFFLPASSLVKFFLMKKLLNWNTCNFPVSAVSFYSRVPFKILDKTRKIAKLRFTRIQKKFLLLHCVPGFISFASVLQLCSQQENFGFV
jgi:hypothetical protein